MCAKTQRYKYGYSIQRHKELKYRYTTNLESCQKAQLNKDTQKKKCMTQKHTFRHYWWGVCLRHVIPTHNWETMPANIVCILSEIKYIFFSKKKKVLQLKTKINV